MQRANDNAGSGHVTRGLQNFPFFVYEYVLNVSSPEIYEKSDLIEFIKPGRNISFHQTRGVTKADEGVR